MISGGIFLEPAEANRRLPPHNSGMVANYGLTYGMKDDLAHLLDQKDTLPIGNESLAGDGASPGNVGVPGQRCHLSG